MAKRKSKPAPAVDPADAEAEAAAHARAETVTDPPAFEFGFGAAAEAVPAAAGDPDRSAPGPAASEEPPRRRARDPFPVASITLGTEKESPRVRLFRSERLKQVAIRFDEKPEAKYLEQLRDAGFKWRQDEGVWTKQFDADARWRTMAEAEKLFEAVGNGLRSDLGLPPVRVLGG